MRTKKSSTILFLILTSIILISCSLSGSGQIRDKETSAQSDLENADNSQQSSDETIDSTDQNSWDALFHSGVEITKTNIAQISLLDQINIDSYDIVWSPDVKQLYLTANHVLYVYSTNNLSEGNN